MAQIPPPDEQNKRRVKTRDGCYGLVYADFSGYASVQLERGGLYKVYKQTDLEDVEEQEFKRHFR